MTSPAAPDDPETDYARLSVLATKWRERAKRTLMRAKHEDDPATRAMLEYGGRGLYNCWMDLREVLGIPLPDVSLDVPQDRV